MSYYAGRQSYYQSDDYGGGYSYSNGYSNSNGYAQGSSSNTYYGGGVDSSSGGTRDYYDSYRDRGHSHSRSRQRSPTRNSRSDSSARATGLFKPDDLEVKVRCAVEDEAYEGKEMYLPMVIQQWQSGKQDIYIVSVVDKPYSIQCFNNSGINVWADILVDGERMGGMPIPSGETRIFSRVKVGRVVDDYTGDADDLLRPLKFGRPAMVDQSSGQATIKSKGGLEQLGNIVVEWYDVRESEWMNRDPSSFTRTDLRYDKSVPEAHNFKGAARACCTVLGDVVRQSAPNRKRGYDGSSRGGGGGGGGRGGEKRTSIRKGNTKLHETCLKYAEYGTLKGMGLQVQQAELPKGAIPATSTEPELDAKGNVITSHDRAAADAEQEAKKNSGGAGRKGNAPIKWYNDHFDLTADEDRPEHRAVKKQCVCLDAELVGDVEEDNDDGETEESIWGDIEFSDGGEA